MALHIHRSDGPRPVGGVPRQITGQHGFVWSFYSYRAGSFALGIVESAIELIEERTAASETRQSCDAAFARIRAVSFSEILSLGGHTVTIHRSPTTYGSAPEGATLVIGGRSMSRHMTLGPNCWRLPPAQRRNPTLRNRLIARCASTIVHELAHCVGAPDEPSPIAERMLLQCGFEDQYDPAFSRRPVVLGGEVFNITGQVPN